MPKDFWKPVETGENIIYMPDVLGEAEDMTYRVPADSPHILVDQVGYRTGGKKLAIFLGTEEPVSYRILDAKTEKVVWQGTTEKKGQLEKSDTHVSYGVFTDLTTEGRYYLEADEFGRSCLFTISDQVYDRVYESLYQALEAGVETNDSMQNCFLLANVLTAYELYPQVDQYEQERMQGQQSNQESGDQTQMPHRLFFGKRVLEQVCLTQNVGDGSIEQDATKTAAFVSVAAQLSRLIQEYDPEYAAKCRKEAERAWNYAVRYDAERDELYAAATQLFRLTGKPGYHVVIKEYHPVIGADTPEQGAVKNRPYTSQNTERGTYDMEIYGDVTYLMTEQGVDVELCKQLMTQRMAKVEKIAARSHENLFQIAEAADMQGIGTMLQEMVQLAMIDYVITNHEYATVMEDHLHFLLGRNPQGASLLSDLGQYFGTGQKMDLLKNAEDTSELLFLLSAVLSHEEWQAEAQS